jgi:homoserine O-acetyltransferase
MIALAFAELFPGRLERLVVISAAHRAHPMSIALRSLQSRVVELGLDTGRSVEALAIARGIAMTTYRTAGEFALRFAETPALTDGRATFEVERYLEHCGARFAAAFPPERFLALSLSADLHRVAPENIRVPATIVAAEGDTLVPEEQLLELAGRLGAPARLLHIATRRGHDAFLTEPEQVGRILAGALSAAAGQVAA